MKEFKTIREDGIVEEEIKKVTIYLLYETSDQRGGSSRLYQQNQERALQGYS